MIQQTPGKIFLSDQRGVIETDGLKSYCTFNFGKYFHEYKEPFGDLYLFNEETLKPNVGIDLEITEASYVIIVPLVGEVLSQAGENPTLSVHVEEVVVHYIPSGQVLHLANPYELDSVSFLQIRLKTEGGRGQTTTSWIYPYAFAQLENKVSEIISRHPLPSPPAVAFKLGIGRFEGRHEALYKASHKNSLLFAHVLSGAFEVEGRLMHEKDGLALWNTRESEIEALSNNALLLVIEIFGKEK